MDLIYGARRLDRRVRGVEELLRAWRERERDLGQLYLDHKPATLPDRVLVEDLAVTMLFNSRVAGSAAASAFRHGAAVDLGSLPDTALEDTTDAQRHSVADLIASIARWPGFGASLATKTLHKKRPALIPVLDNQAIFGAYMNPRWPDRRSQADTVKDVGRIREALDWIAHDLVRPENAPAWPRLQAMERERSRIELFDMIWWMHFRQIEPAGQPASTPRTVPLAEWPVSAPSADVAEADVLVFRGDDEPYLRWISEHPDGYVVNSERKPRLSYLKLHRAVCPLISDSRDRPGAYTERGYIKICSLGRPALERWARYEVGGAADATCACL